MSLFAASLCLVSFTLLLALPRPAAAQFALDLETGGVWFTRNDAKIPNDAEGDEFDLLDLTGSGPDAFFRLGADWEITGRQGLRLVIAPLSVDGTGDLLQETRFVDTTFAPGPTEAEYRFNTYRLTWRYTFHDGEAWRWRIGVTGLVRDANIELTQGALQDNDDNVGFVPLLHLYGEYAIGPRWQFIFDFDGLAGGPGRAFDAALKLTYDVNDHWQLGGGYRTLEGGADNDDVFSFAWLHYGVLTARYRF